MLPAPRCSPPPPFAQGFSNSDSSNNLSSLQKPFPTATLGYVPRTPTSQLSDRVAGPDYLSPAAATVEPQHAISPVRGLSLSISAT